VGWAASEPEKMPSRPGLTLRSRVRPICPEGIVRAGFAAGYVVGHYLKEGVC